MLDNLGPGSCLADRYVIRSLLGMGGMASVFAADDQVLHRRVALKLLRPSLRGPAAIARFLKEARAMAVLDSPHLVPLFDLGWHAETPFLVMKLLSGRTLREVLDEAPGGLPGARALAIIAQLLKALAHMHRRGFIHRDIKPSNAFVAADDHVTLVDLGIAFDAGTDAGTRGLVVGTPPYMAPEQGKGETGDARSDIYSVGLLLFEALTGRLPFAEPYAPGVKRSLSPAALSAIAPGFTEVVMRAIDPDPGQRFATAAEMRSRLLRLENLRPGKTPPAPLTPTPVGTSDADTQIGRTPTRARRSKAGRLRPGSTSPARARRSWGSRDRGSP